MNILDLPNVMLIQIIEYLPYEEVAKKRLICKKIDMVCQHILNCGFNKVVKQHTISLKRIKALLPRRESERRNHCLARHADILTCIETRISMLSMTYSKYMDLNLCCFIPGRVLDEIFRILRLISKTTKPLRPHEVLQELRDISSMAIEHFDEKISHSLKKSFVDTNTQIYSGSATSSSSNTLEMSSKNVYLLLGLGQNTIETTQVSVQPKVPQAVKQAPPHGEKGCDEARATMRYFKKFELQYKKGVSKMNQMLHVQNNQSRRLHQSLGTITELNMQIIELKKRMEDMDAKNRELTASIKQLKGESTATPTTSQPTPTVPEYTNPDGNPTMLTDDTPKIVDLIASVKRHIDEPPLGEAGVATDTDVSITKKAKVE